MDDGWSSAISRASEEQPGPTLPGYFGGMGRPRGRFAEIDWVLGEKLYVEGEEIHSIDGGEPERAWPTLESIGKRLGCTMQAVFNHAKRNKWKEKKRKFQYEFEHGEYVARAEDRPNPASRLTRKPIEIVEDYLALFEDAVKNRKLRADAVGDFDKAVRLRAFLLNEGAAEQTKRQLMSLEEMRERHESSRARRATYDEVAAGVIQEDQPNDGVNAPRARPEEHASMGTQTHEPGEAPKPTKVKLTPDELRAKRSERAKAMCASISKEERARRAQKAADTRAARQAVAARRRRKAAGFKG